MTYGPLGSSRSSGSSCAVHSQEDTSECTVHLGKLQLTTSPGGRYAGATWSLGDSLYLFGGYGHGEQNTASHGEMNDLWMFSISGSVWTWLGGSKERKAASTLGTLGSPSATAWPGARQKVATWQVGTRFYMYGGDGPNGTAPLADLWLFDPSSRLWAWLGGGQGASPANYGLMGVYAPTNSPGSRRGAVRGQDPSSGALFLYGGLAGDYNNSYGDMWMLPVLPA